MYCLVAQKKKKKTFYVTTTKKGEHQNKLLVNFKLE